MRTHDYHVTIRWTGNLGTGTSGYRAYSRNHDIEIAGKTAPIAASSDAMFRGDKDRYNPEELLVSAASSCHMLSYLHLCADAGIVVTDYVDEAAGTLALNPDGSGQFGEVVLRPRVIITDGARVGEAEALHHRAHELCFIARSLNFPVRNEPEVRAMPLAATQ
jgi:organic hydroperoxide reductase OsmC/OhrA